MIAVDDGAIAPEPAAWLVEGHVELGRQSLWYAVLVDPVERTPLDLPRDMLLVVRGKEKKEEQKENKDKLSAIIKFENEKWVLKKAKNSEQNVLIYLINKDELLGKQISFGCKLKNNMMINCNSHTLEVVLT